MRGVGEKDKKGGDRKGERADMREGRGVIEREWEREGTGRREVGKWRERTGDGW